MNRQPSRTDLFEEHQEKILNLRQKAVDSRTLSRAYADLEEEILGLRTRGELWDVARKDIATFAQSMSENFLKTSRAQIQEADDLEAKGID